MESFTLTRKDVAQLLLALDGRREDLQPLSVLQCAWKRNHPIDQEQEQWMPAFLDTAVPPVLDKMIKGRQGNSFSLQEIAALGQLIEYSQASLTSMQNWVKRDFKEFLGSPKIGKKYSINQAALLLIVEDLKASLDFESIRRLFHILFQEPTEDADDWIEPVELYAAYSTMFEELDANNDQMLDIAGHTAGGHRQDSLTESVIRTASDRYAGRLHHLLPGQRKAVGNVLLIAAVSVQTSYFLSMARRYVNATLFLEF
ncbi:DUF1836 domain-containing protein [Paenibacillus sp. JX-17]|uniref:DUF1836 domain-containing protein n=1 Tax=Paenibacillus lacisoli TaxID=3064525 RepID=A0ABT9CF49_9BACL|nr:DUF1836 domain-containing protein [Paenibacillus sp. JX-17]MDO7907893.1 DUF1836 domain-containing protein [Paenibacillus sp. JX-17]